MMMLCRSGESFGMWAVLFVGVATLTACGRSPVPPAGAVKTLVGSTAWATCHQDIYTRWKDTLMATGLTGEKAS